jgi:hypothetical protein
MAKPTKAKKPEILYVDIREAKPNKMFSEEQRQGVRFLVYNRAIPCAACGKKRRVMWTMLCQFKAGDTEHSFVVLKNYAQSFAPLTPVCGDHPLGPDWPDKKKPAGANQNTGG